MKLRNIATRTAVFTITSLFLLPSLIIAIPSTVYADAAVTTGSASLSDNTFTLNGTVNSIGGSPITERGIEYGSTDAYGYTNAEDISSGYGYSVQWGSEGSGDGQFNNPYGIAIDANDNVYVADYNNHRIQKFDSSGNFISKWGSEGSGDGQFFIPSSVATDLSGNVYVAEWGNNRIQKFDSSGNFISKWGSIGSGDGQFNTPTGMVTDLSDNVYVADYNNHRIQKFDSSGNFIAKWGSQGSGDGQLNYPYGIAIDSSNSVYVTEAGNHRIQKFDSSGNFIAKWGSQGSGDGQFNEPPSVATDSSENVYVADNNNHRIQKFTPTDGSGTFSYSDNASEVPCETTIHYRAYATNDEGTVYGQDATFKFPDCPPSPDLALTAKQTSPLPVKANDTLTYDITAKNIGAVSYTGLVGLYITIPANSTYNSLTIKNPNITYQCQDFGPAAGLGAPAFSTYTGNIIGCVENSDEISLPAGGFVKFSLSLTASSDFTPGTEVLHVGGFLESGYEPDTAQIEMAAGGNAPFYDLNINNIVNLVYGQDNDKISDSVENAAPNNGDGNNDGVPDAIQRNVTSLVSPVTNKYVTVVSPDGTSLTNVAIHAEATNGKTNNDTGYDYPFGIISFTLEDVDPGSTNTVSFIQHNPPSTNPNDYTARKHKPTTGDTFSITNEDSLSITQQTIDNQPAIQLAFAIIDGGKLDLDGTADGTIIDPVGLATATNDSELSDTGQNTVLLTLSSITLIIATTTILLRLKSKKFN